MQLLHPRSRQIPASPQTKCHQHLGPNCTPRFGPSLALTTLGTVLPQLPKYKMRFFASESYCVVHYKTILNLMYPDPRLDWSVLSILFWTQRGSPQKQVHAVSIRIVLIHFDTLAGFPTCVILSILYLVFNMSCSVLLTHGHPDVPKRGPVRWHPLVSPVSQETSLPKTKQADA